MLDLGAMSLKIKVDGADKAKSDLSSVKTAASNLAKGIGKGTVAIAKGLAAGVAAGASATALIVKQAVDSYAEYEQLVGGVDTLFKESSSKVQQYAANAYKTAGMSANQYMSTVTGFSASLLQSLGGDTEKAADYADRAIVDMADNANKMGTSMESIQNAYQGFAKQNYTMLDNLKLGYGGTKEEMQRLLNDAEKLTGKKFDLSNFGDITEAIHVIQDSMGITGATAAEASTTIEGSVNTAKAAWSNLVTGMADENANMGELINNFVDSVVQVGQNILPVAEQSLNGVITLIEQLFPKIVQKIPEIIAEYLPRVVEAGVMIIQTLIQGITKNPQNLVKTIMNCIKILLGGISKCLPDLMVAGVELLLHLALGLVKAVPQLLAEVPKIVGKVVQSFKNNKGKFGDVGKQLLQALWDAMKSIWNSLISWAGGAISDFLSIFSGLGSKLYNAGKDALQNFWNGIKSIWGSITSWVSEKIEWVKNKFSGIKNIFSGSHRNGLREVPYDGYVAELHKGEMILTAAEAKRYQKGGTGGSVVNNLTVNNYSPKALNEAESARQFRKTQRQLAFGF